MFNLFAKKKVCEEIGAPMSGEAVASAEINDPAFSGEMMGQGMAIRPSEGKVYAPVEGSVVFVFDTKHALSVVSDQGAEVLIHIGLDTVLLKGEHFKEHVKAGDKVKKGDLLLEFDMEAITAAGFDLTSPIIICNSQTYERVERFVGKSVHHGDKVMELEKK